MTLAFAFGEKEEKYDVEDGPYTEYKANPIIFTIYAILNLILFLPHLSAAVRRLHDTGKSGCFVWIVFVPLAGIFILIVLLCIDSVMEQNIYGPCPKYENQNYNDFNQGYNNIDNQVNVSPPLINYNIPNQENIIHSQGIFVYQNNCNNSEISDVYPSESIN